MKINSSGMDMIKHFESCSLTAYPDPASALAVELRKTLNMRCKNWEKLSGAPYTVGWGSTGIDDSVSPPRPICATTVWTQVHADHRLATDVENFAKQMLPLIKVELNDNQFSALVCFTYNVGLGNFKSSTLLNLINRGKYADAALEFAKWNKAKGKVLNGLTARRDAERRLFITPIK
jgi:lysozyme